MQMGEEDWGSESAVCEGGPPLRPCPWRPLWAPEVRISHEEEREIVPQQVGRLYVDLEVACSHQAHFPQLAEWVSYRRISITFRGSSKDIHHTSKKTVNEISFSELVPVTVPVALKNDAFRLKESNASAYKHVFEQDLHG